mgnify:CR=1 FL=1
MGKYLDMFGQTTRSLENDNTLGYYEEEQIRTAIVHARQDIGASGIQLVELNVQLSSIRFMLFLIIVILGTLTAKVLGWF